MVFKTPRQRKAVMAKIKARPSYKVRFQDHFMQRQYEDLIAGGMHWRQAEDKVLRVFKAYDEGTL